MTDTINPPTPADLAQIRMAHRRYRDLRDGGVVCADCCDPWPCPMVRVLTALDAARAQLTLAERYLSLVTFVGHNDDCLFCGFKDQAVKNYEDELAALTPGAAEETSP